MHSQFKLHPIVTISNWSALFIYLSEAMKLWCLINHTLKLHIHFFKCCQFLLFSHEETYLHIQYNNDVYIRFSFNQYYRLKSSPYTWKLQAQYLGHKPEITYRWYKEIF
jgi:hypothetical protein